MAVTISSMVKRWSALSRPLFKNALITPDGCKCAQGDVLSCAGFSDDDLRLMRQLRADVEVARILGISRKHSVLLRVVNDRTDGAPQVVLTDPEQVLGENASLLLAFWWHLESMNAAAWKVVEAAAQESWASSQGVAWDAAWKVVEAAGRTAAGFAAYGVAREVSWDTGRISVRASSEIQGMLVLEKYGRHLTFSRSSASTRGTKCAA